MYIEKQFNLPTIEGLSDKQIQAHLGLYAGYVKNTNVLLQKLELLKKEKGDAYIIAELQRRLGFEFDGMRMHEYYFDQLEGGAKSPDENGDFVKYVTEQFGGFEEYTNELREIASTRGIGWVVTYYDTKVKLFVNSWVGDHEFGQLAGLPIVFVMDMWEHAFMVDYLPSQKVDYVGVYLSNVNWSVVESRTEQLNIV
jgi:Fe-Mn family superoxide dismutase